MFLTSQRQPSQLFLSPTANNVICCYVAIGAIYWMGRFLVLWLDRLGRTSYRAGIGPSMPKLKKCKSNVRICWENSHDFLVRTDPGKWWFFSVHMMLLITQFQVQNHLKSTVPRNTLLEILRKMDKLFKYFQFFVFYLEKSPTAH